MDSLSLLISIENKKIGIRICDKHNFNEETKCKCLRCNKEIELLEKIDKHRKECNVCKEKKECKDLINLCEEKGKYRNEFSWRNSQEENTLDILYVPNGDKISAKLYFIRDNFKDAENKKLITYCFFYKEDEEFSKNIIDNYNKGNICNFCWILDINSDKILTTKPFFSSLVDKEKCPLSDQDYGDKIHRNIEDIEKIKLIRECKNFKKISIDESLIFQDLSKGKMDYYVYDCPLCLEFYDKKSKYYKYCSKNSIISIVILTLSSIFIFFLVNYIVNEYII